MGFGIVYDLAHMLVVCGIWLYWLLEVWFGFGGFVAVWLGFWVSVFSDLGLGWGWVGWLFNRLCGVWLVFGLWLISVCGFCCFGWILWFWACWHVLGWVLGLGFRFPWF